MRSITHGPYATSRNRNPTTASNVMILLMLSLFLGQRYGRR
jgi:hypothetical protein